MNLTDITLEKIAEAQFAELWLHWKGREYQPREEPVEYGRIVHTIIFPDFESLIQSFLETKNSHKVSYDNDGWKGVRKRELNDEAAMSEVLRALNACKDSVLNFEFRRNPGTSDHYHSYLDAMQMDGEVVIFSANIQSRFRNAYTLRGFSNPSYRIRGLLDPEHSR